MEEYLGRLQVKVAKRKFQKNNRRQKEQFINGINNETITAKIV